MYSSTTQQAIEKSSRLIGVFAMAVAWGVIVVCLFPVSASAQVSISGTLYENDGVTAITSTKTIVAAVATSTVSLYSTTTEVSGAYTITITDNIADGVYLSSTTPVTLFVNDNDTMSPDLASTLTYAISSTTDMTGIDLQAGRVIFNNATGVAEVSLATDSVYDGTDDTDILFTMTSATTSVVGDMLITSGTTLRVADALELSGDFTQQGEFVASTSEVIFSGLTPQIATGTMQGTSQFYDLTITNTSGTGDGTQSVTFGSPVMATGTFSMVADTSAAFTASYAPTDTPHSFNTVNWQGGGNATEIYLRSTDAGFNWYAAIDGAQMIDFVNVQDNFASVASGTVVAQNSTNAGNNTNWVFANDVPYWSQNQWTLYDSITIDAANIDEDLTDFPVYVDLSDLSTQFWNTVTNGGGDIRVTTDSNTEVSREVVSASTTLKTGELHFKAPTISSTTDTTFRIWYNGSSDDYATTSTYGAQAVWSNEYVYVSHDGGGTDSTANASNGTASGTLTYGDSTGSLGAATSYTGGSYSDLGNGSVLEVTFPFTLQAWVNSSTTAGFTNILSTDEYSNSMYAGAAIRLTNTINAVEAATGDASGNSSSNRRSYTTAASVAVDTWTQVVGVFADFDDRTTYINMSSSTNAVSGTATTLGYSTQPASVGYDFEGSIDEVRIASTSRSAAWIAAEYLNQATTTDFYTRSGGNSLATVTDHEAGQVSNAFGSQDEINKALFAFNLIPESDTATVTALTFDLYGVVGIDSSDFSNIRLYKDYDDDALYDVTDEQVGGVGSMSLGATFGTISFTEDFAATSSRNYVLVADWNEPERGAILNISLSPNKVTMVDAEGSVIVGGLVDNAQHGRISGFGGGSGSSAAIGSAAPAGNGVITGGTNEGGELIGNDPDFYLPTVDSGSWSNGSQTYDGIDGTYASDATGTDHTFSVFTNSIPSTNSIEGIVVKLEVSGTTAAGDIGVELSWDAGSTFTSTGYNTGTLTTTDTIVALGGTSDVWGRAWTPGELSDANFRVRVTGNPSSNTVQIDAIQVKVYHQSSGGSQSGGGAI